MNTSRMLALVLTLLLLVGMVPVTSMAEGSRTYLAIGDSISTGYGLANPATESFTAQVAETLGEDYTYVNQAKDGETAASLYAKLTGTDTSAAAFQAAVQNADVITLTIGGNDLMHLLYEFLADNISPQMTAEEIAAALAAGNMDVVNAAATTIVDKGFTPDASSIAGILGNISGVVDRIRTLNADAALIISTQYNPYASLAVTMGQYMSFLSGSYATAAQAIIELSNTIDNALKPLNSNLKTALDGKCEIADVGSAFAASSANLCNAALTIMPSVSVNLDIHPNAAGHTVIAELFANAIPKYVPALAAPTNLRWDGTSAKWDAVAGATGYSVQLYKDGAALRDAFSVLNTTTTYDFTFISNLERKGTYYFTVVALGDGVNNSDSPSAESSAKSFGEWPITIITQPQDQSVVEGQTATFTVAARGYEQMSYQWYINRNDGQGWCEIYGATSSSYTTSPTALDCNGFQYCCVLTNEYNLPTQSDIAHLYVSEVSDIPITGDSSQPMLYLTLLLTSLAGMLLMKKKQLLPR